MHVIDIQKGSFLISSACFLKDGIKQWGPYNINRSIESTNEIFKFIYNIQQDNAIKVNVNLNHGVIYIILFWKSNILFETKYRSFICNMTYIICFL